MIVNKRLSGLVLALWSVSLQAQLPYTFDFTEFDDSLPELPIPDGNAAGVSDTRTIALPVTEIGSLGVSLQIGSDPAQGTGSAFNGDLYVYLRHDTGFSVLLNRVGRGAADPAGYDDSGFQVTLRDSAANGDIHTHRAGSDLAMTGIWQPDGRDVDPGDTVDTSLRTALLSAFNGLDPNGTWTLFAVDLQSGGAARIESWGLEITPVPEPHQYALAIGAALLIFAAWRKLDRRNEFPIHPAADLHR